MNRWAHTFQQDKNLSKEIGPSENCSLFISSIQLICWLRVTVNACLICGCYWLYSRSRSAMFIFLNIGTRPIFLKWKFQITLSQWSQPVQNSHSDYRLWFGENLCQRWGSNLRPCTPRWQTMIQTVFLWLSWHPGIVAAWYDHPQSRPVRSGHWYFMARCDPDQDLGSFWRKRH